MDSIQNHFQDFLQLLNQQNVSTSDIDNNIEKSQSLFQNNSRQIKENILNISQQISKWIKQNLESNKTKNAYKYISCLYSAIGNQFYFELDCFYQGLEEDDKQSQKKESNESNVNFIFSNEYLHNDLILLCISHLTSISQQKKQSQEMKEILLQILKVSCLYAEEKEIQNFCRRQKTIKIFLKLYHDIIQKNESVQTVDIEISALVTNLLVKLTYKNKKNADYMIQKKSYELIKGILISAQDYKLYSGACFLLSNLCYNIDTRLLLWVSGIFNFLQKKYKTLLQEYKNGDKKQKKFIQATLIMMLKLCSDCEEIIDEICNDKELKDDLYFFIDLSENEILSDVDLLAIYGSCIGIQRKIASFKKYREQIAATIMMKSMNFLHKNVQNKVANEFRIKMIYCYKELIALLGVFAIEDIYRDKILTQCPKISTNIVRIALQFFEDVKLVKTTIGCLTNFAVVEQCRDELSSEKDFYVIVYNVLEQFDYSVSLLEYVLKMIMNTSSNSLCFKNYSAPKFILKLIFLSFIYQGHYIIVTLLFKIFRVLAQDDQVLTSFVKCVREYEASNKDFRFMRVIAESMKSVMVPSQDIIQDIILFASTILQIDKDFISEMQEKTQFIVYLKEYVDRNRHDEKIIEKISQCIACLPLEDFKSILML